MDGDLNVKALRDVETAIYRGRGGAPVLVQFEPHRPRAQLLLERTGQTGISLAEKAQVHGERLGRFEHSVDIPGPGGAGGGVGACGRTGAAPEHGGHPGHQGFLYLLGADEVNVGVDRPGGQDLALPGDRLRPGTDDDVDPGLNIRIAGFADRGNAPVLDTDVGFDDPPVVQNEGVGDDGVDDLGRSALALPHAVADHFAAAELDLLTVDRPVRLHLDEEGRIAQANAVTDGRAVDLGVGLPTELAHHAVPSGSSGPITAALKPYTVLSRRRPPAPPPALARLEADRGPGRDIEPVPPCPGPVEVEGVVGLEKV